MRILSTAAAFAILLLSASTTLAEATERDMARYREVIADALREFRLGNWAEATSLFKEAHRLNPNARTLRGLGLAAYESRRYVDCVDFLHKAIDERRQPLTEKQRTHALGVIDRAQGFIARYHVVLEPPTAALTVDGEPSELRDDDELWLDPGTHELIASSPGHEDVVRRLSTKAGASLELKLRLEATADQDHRAPPALVPVGDPPPTAVDQGLRPPAALHWALIGGGGALLIGSAITGVMSNSERSDAESKCDPSACDDPTAQDSLDRMETLATVTDVLWITGVAAAGTGIALWLLGVPEPEQTPAAAVACAADGCFGRLSAEF